VLFISSFPILSSHFACIPSLSILFNVYLTCLLAAASSSDTTLKSQLSSNLTCIISSARPVFVIEIWDTRSVPSFFVTPFSQTILSPSVDFGCNLCTIHLVLSHFFGSSVLPSVQLSDLNNI
jgi:hypothetical protein